MKVLDVEFKARRPIANGVWVALILALAVLTVDQGTRAWDLYRQTQRLRLEDARAREEIAQLEQAERDAAALAAVEPPYAKDATALLKIAQFPLDRVFKSLEGARVIGVRVTSLQISAVDGTARAEVEFSDHGVLMDYLDALNSGEPEAKWLLQQSQVGASGAPGTASIGSVWQGPSK